MAIYGLLVCLVILFFISYQLCDKDFFNPATMLTLSFIFSTLCAIYKYPTWQYTFTMHTTVLIVTALSFSVAIARGVKHISFLTWKNTRVDNISPISISAIFIALVIIIVTIVTMIHQILQVVGIATTINEIMGSYRNNVSYSTDLENQLPQWLKILLYFVNSFSYLFSFDLIYFWNQHKFKRKIINILIIVLCMFTGLLNGGRFGMATLLCSAVVMLHFIRIKKMGMYKKYKIILVIKTMLLIIAAFMIFYYAKTLVGREDDQGILGYIGHYFGGGIPLLDWYLREPTSTNNIWGEETFYSLINNLRRVGIINIDYYYKHHEFRYINGNSMGNVYTAFRDYYHDYGVIGMYILHITFSMIFSLLYEAVKKNRGVIEIIVFSTIYYCIIFYTFNNSFFASIVSLGFVLQTTILLILYEIFIRKKIKIVMNGK